MIAWPIVAVLGFFVSVPLIHCRAWTHYPEGMSDYDSYRKSGALGRDQWSFENTDKRRSSYIVFWSITSFFACVLYPISIPVLSLSFVGFTLFKFLGNSGKACALKKKDNQSCGLS